MKKFLIFALAGAFVLTLGVCGKKTQLSETEHTVDGEMTGAWRLKEDMTVTDEVKELLEKATADLDGAAYEPVAYIASQVVSGRNHLLLCTITPVVPDGEARYALVTLYQDLQGNVTITEVLDCESTEGAAGLLGGWQVTEYVKVTDEHVEIMKNALEGFTGASYRPLAFLATQVVAGTNYRFLCQMITLGTASENKYAIVEVYRNLQGKAEIKDIYTFSK